MAKQKTLYYLPTYGQLGNQLATIAHLLAFAIEYNYVVVYPHSNYFSEHLAIAQNKHSRLQFSQTFAKSILTRSISKLLKLIFLNRNSYAFDYLIINKKFVAEKDFNTAKQPSIIIVTDWLFRNYEGIVKHQNELRKQLSFTNASVEKAKQKWLLLQQDYPNQTFIGVHVRRGDYADWLGGKYFYDNAAYYAWMKQLSEQIKHPVFIVCANEDLHFENESNLNIVYAKGSPSEDLYLLSQCEYIMGPPSTFSSWAAFLGNKYLWLLETKDEMIQLNQFEKFYLK